MNQGRDRPTTISTGGELRQVLEAFNGDIRLVTQDGQPAEAYYRVEANGEGVIVVRPIGASPFIGMVSRSDGGLDYSSGYIDATAGKPPRIPLLKGLA